MPVRLDAKLPSDLAEARIEIIPLIDIMFFLLASFMLVSLSMVNLKSVPVNLPTAVSAVNESKRDFIDISVDKAGSAYVDKKAVDDNELIGALVGFRRANPNVPHNHKRRYRGSARRRDPRAGPGAPGGNRKGGV